MQPLTSVQKLIRVDVCYFDDAERDKLLRYPTASIIKQIVAQPVEVPMAEFLTYYLFHRKRLGTTYFGSYNAIGEKLQIALASLDGCIDFNGHSICTPSGVKKQLNEISEHVGEAIGLAVMNRIHGLTEADWAPIPEQHGRKASPTFDFQLEVNLSTTPEQQEQVALPSGDFQTASDGFQFVQLESKGSSNSDNRVADPNALAQKRRIDQKKEKLVKLDQVGRNPYPVAWRYGTIAVVDPRREGNVKCWLTDPPADRIDANPAYFRLLQRMRFLQYWISLISGRSQLAAALATRIGDLEVMTNPFELDGLPLRKGNNEPFAFEVFDNRSQRHSSFMSNKSVVIDGPAGGLVLQPSHESLFMLGIQEKLLNIASDQNFQEIGNYTIQVGTYNKKVRCTFSEGRFHHLDLPASIESSAKTRGGYVSFELSGQLHYSQEGLVFGELPLPES